VTEGGRQIHGRRIIASPKRRGTEETRIKDKKDTKDIKDEKSLSRVLDVFDALFVLERRAKSRIQAAMATKRILPFLLVLLAPALHAQEKSLHLAVGDPARKDKEATVVLDGITDTRTGEVIAPAELPKRLAGVRLLLVGESHTDMDYHRCELRVVQELTRSGRPVILGLEMYPLHRAEISRRLGRW
jgi:hypothetical protein